MPAPPAAWRETATRCDTGAHLRTCTPAGVYPPFAGNGKAAWPPHSGAAGTHRLFAGGLQIVVTNHGSIVFKGADEVIASVKHQT